jgi:hypothetical protein
MITKKEKEALLVLRISGEMNYDAPRNEEHDIGLGMV